MMVLQLLLLLTLMMESCQLPQPRCVAESCLDQSKVVGVDHASRPCRQGGHVLGHPCPRPCPWVSRSMVGPASTRRHSYLVMHTVPAPRFYHQSIEFVKSLFICLSSTLTVNYRCKQCTFFYHPFRTISSHFLVFNYVPTNKIIFNFFLVLSNQLFKTVVIFP